MRLSKLVKMLEQGDVSGLDRESENRDRFDMVEEKGVGWSILADRIVTSNRRGGFTSAIIYGRQGAGKSVYSIKVAYDALRRLDEIPAKATTEHVFKRYMVFTAQQFISKLKNARGSRLPLLIWDDAGVHGGSYIFFTDVHLAKALGDLFRVARTRTAAILFTTPSPSDLLKPFRSYDTIIVYIHELDDVWSRAHIYQLRLLPSGDARIFKVAQEDFKRRLRTYGEYVKMRDKYVDYAIDALEQLLELKRLERERRRAKLLGHTSTGAGFEALRGEAG